MKLIFAHGIVCETPAVEGKVYTKHESEIRHD